MQIIYNHLTQLHNYDQVLRNQIAAALMGQGQHGQGQYEQGQQGQGQHGQRGRARGRRGGRGGSVQGN
ncbi:unnamed protein product [Meloidogyne enterolobii]|uniref:Uncharacterized protein n=1 Tax=Meloidogyne enterolobii TaxID=390850 RepID=A0ACB0XQ81_MELEN